ESVGDIPTEDILLKLRQHRDAGWLVIRNKLNNQPVDDQLLEDFTKGAPLDLAFEESVRNSDDTADLMRREAEKLGEKNKLVLDIKTSEGMLDQLADKSNDVKETLKKWNEDWENEWRPANIQPLTPEEMIEWLGKYEEI